MFHSQWQHLGELATAGGACRKPWPEPGSLVEYTSVQSASGSFLAAKFNETMSALLCQSPGGTAWTDLLSDSSVCRKISKFFAGPATKARAKQRTQSDELTQEERVGEKSLTERVKSLLEDDKLRVSARKIELASQSILGDDHFIFYGGQNSDAEKLACIDLDKFDRFVEEVKRIRSNIDTEYMLAAQGAFGGNDEQA